MKDNQINAVNVSEENTLPQKTQQSANFDYQTQSWAKGNLMQEVNDTQVNAFTSFASGAPIIPDLEIAKSQPVVDTTPITPDFSARDEVMSKIGLMDKDYNYTDTYTNYIRNGGAPVPGYEQDHFQILRQEEIESIFKKYDDGEISYETALMDAYGKDILQANGYDVTSVAWWMNKFMNSDFSHPFQNKYIMDSILSAAESYHEQRMASKWAHTPASETKLSTLLGADLTEKQIRELFPDLDQAINSELKDGELLSAIYDNTISANYRLRQTGDGKWYYLHTDGELYVLDGASGDHHGTIQLDANGKPTAIDLNNSGLVSFGRSFVTGFTNIFSSPVSLIFNLCGSSSFDDWWHDDVGALSDTGYVDLDSSHISSQDVLNFVGSMAGSIAGTMTLGAITNVGSSVGSKLLASDNLLAKASGGILKGASTALKWQTGNFGTNVGTGGSAMKIWGRRIGAAVTANAKNYFNDYSNLVEQNYIYNYGLSDDDLRNRALVVNGANTVIDILISGGMDDNQWQAYTGRDTISESATTDFKKAIQESIDLRNNPELLNDFREHTSEAFQKYMTSRAKVIAFNSGMDFVGNMLTGYVSKYGKINSNTGKLETIDDIKAEGFDWGLFARSAINTYWYSYRSQKREFFSGLNCTKELETKLMDKFDQRIQKLSNPQDIETLRQVQKQFYDDIQNSKAATAEGKRLEALSKLSDNLADPDHPVADIVKTTLDEVINPRVIQECQKLYENAELSYLAMEHKVMDLQNAGVHKSNLFKGILKWVWNAGVTDNKIQAEYIKQASQEQLTANADNAQLQFLKSLFPSEEDVNNLEKQREYIPEDKRVSNIKAVTGRELKMSESKLYKEIDDKLKDSKQYMIIPNNVAITETSDEIAALRVMEDLGYVKQVKTDKGYVFEISNYNDQIGALKQGYATNMIYDTVLALRHTAENTEAQQQIVTRFIESMVDKTATKQQVTLMVTQILNRLKTPVTKDSTPVLSEKQAAELFGQLKEAKLLTKVDDATFDQFNKSYDTLKSLYKHGTVNTADSDVMKTIKKMKDQGEISEEQYNAIMDINRNQENFYHGDHSSSQFNFMVNIINQKGISASPTEGYYHSKEDILLYLKANGVDTEDETLKQKLNEAFELHNKAFKNSKAVGIQDHTVYVDLKNLMGKTTERLATDILNQHESVVKKLDSNDAYKNYGYDVTQELNAKAKWMGKSNSQFLKFNLDNDTEVDRFNQLLKDFHYDQRIDVTKDLDSQINKLDFEGIKTHSGETVVLDIPQINNLEELQDAIDRGTLRIIDKDNNETAFINFGKRMEASAFEGPKENIAFKIMNTVTVENLDSRLNIKLKQLPLLQINPFVGENLDKLKFEDVAFILLKNAEDEANLKKASGKESTKVSQTLLHTMQETTAASVGVDKDLETFFICKQIVDDLTNDKNARTSIPMNYEEVQRLHDAGVVKNHGEDSDAFWEITPEGDRIFLAATKDELNNYIVSKNFNIYKLVPLDITEIGDRKHGTIGAYSKYGTDAMENTPEGAFKETGLSLLNIRLPWDTDNSHLDAFFQELINHRDTYSYNPYSGSVTFKLDNTEWDLSTDEGYEKWYTHIQDSTDPYDMLMKRYMDAFETVIKTGDAKNNNNETYIVKNPKLFTRVLQEVQEQTGDINKVTDDLKQMLYKDMTFEIQPRALSYDSSTLSGTKGMVISGGTPGDTDTTYLPKGAITEYAGGTSNIVPISKDDIDILITPEAVQRAIKLVADAYDEDSFEHGNFIRKYGSIEYVNDPESQFLQQIGGTNGYIPIEDVDTYARLMAENYDAYQEYLEQKQNNIAQGSMDLILKDSFKPLLEHFYGKNYMEVVNKIFDQVTLNKKATLATQTIKNPVMPQSPSITRGYDYALANNVDEQAYKDFTKYVDNYIENHQDRDKYTRLTQNVEDLYDTTMDAINKKVFERTKRDRTLYMTSPGTTVAENFISFKNEQYSMNSAINTYNKMKENLGLKNLTPQQEQDLMDAAITMVNTQKGVDYGGDTVNYILLDKNNKLMDMDLYAAGNLRELFVNIYDKTDSLVGATLIKTKPQVMETSAGLDFDYTKLNNEQEVKELTTDLFHYFMLSQYKPTGNTVGQMRAFLQSVSDAHLSTEDLRAIVNSIPTHTLSNNMRYKNLYKTYSKNMENLDMPEDVFYNRIKNTTPVQYATAEEEMFARKVGDKSKIDEAYDKNKDNFKPIADFVNYAIDTETLSDSARNVIQEYKNRFKITSISDRFSAGNQLTTDETVKAFNECVDYIMDNDSAPIIDLLMRNRSIVSMSDQDKDNNAKDMFSINDTQLKKTLDQQDLVPLVDSINTNDPTANTTKFHKIVVMDTETDLDKDIDSKDKYSIFNVGVVIYEMTDDGWKQTRKDIYVNYGDELKPQEWKNGRVKENESFYIRNKGFRDAYQKYLNIENNLDDETFFMTPKEIKQFFSEELTNDSILLGFNIDRADIGWLKKGDMLDDNILKNTTVIDEYLMENRSGATEYKDAYGPGSGKQTSRSKNILPGFSKEKAAHGGLEDALTTLELFKHTVNSTYNISAIKNKAYRDLQPIISKLSPEDQKAILTELDNRMKTVREEMPEIKEYFSPDFVITPKTVNTGLTLMEYVFNKKLNSVQNALLSREINTEISSESLRNLNNQNITEYKKLNDFIINVKGVDPNKYLDTISDICDTANTNSIIETVLTKNGQTRILARLGLSYDDFEKSKETLSESNLLDKTLNSTEWLDKNGVKRYEDNYDINRVSIQLRELRQALDIKDETLRSKILSEMATVYDFNMNDANPLKLFSESDNFVDTKLQSDYYDWLKTNYGDSDAIMAGTLPGVYKLLNSYGFGDKPVHDLLSDSKVDLNSSKYIIITKGLFESLVGKSIHEYKEEYAHMLKANDGLYTSLLINPADNPKQLIGKIIVTNDPGDYIKCAETVLETLGSRDIDGDHTPIIRPNEVAQRVFKIYTDNMYFSHDLQEKTLQFLKQKGIDDHSYEKTYYINNIIGKNPKVLELSRQADELLKKGLKPSDQELKNLTKQFKTLVNKINKDDDISAEKIMDAIWINKANLFEVSTDPNTKYYISNYNIDNDSYSGEMRRLVENYKTTHKPLYSHIDSKTGMEGKNVNVIESHEINNPWTDTLISNIYGSDIVKKYIPSLTVQDAVELKDFISSYLATSGGASEDWDRILTEHRPMIEQSLNNMVDFISKGDYLSAFRSYDAMLQDYEKYIRENLDKTELYNELTSDNMKANYERLREDLENKSKGVAVYNELAKQRAFIRGSESQDRTAFNYTLNNLVNKYYTEGTVKANQKVFENAQKVKAFVITGVSPGSEDAILYNKNTKAPLTSYTLSTIDAKSSDDCLFKQGDEIKAGDKIFKSSNYKAAVDSIIYRIEGKKIYLINKNPIDGNLKMVTSHGGKGAVNTDFGILNNSRNTNILAQYGIKPNDITLMIHQPKQEKIFGGSINAPINGEPIELTVNGGKHIKGYIVDTDVVTVENTANWHELNDRNVDTLTKITSSGNILGMVEYGAGTVKEGKLYADQTELKDLANSIFNVNKHSQTTNFLIACNDFKMAYLLDKIPDAELEKDFGNKAFADDIRKAFAETNIKCTNFYNSVLYTLQVRHNDLIDYSNDIINKLFSNNFYNLMGKREKTAITNLNLENIFSKREPDKQGSAYKEDGIFKTSQVSSTVKIKDTDDDLVNMLNEYEGTEELDINYFDGMNYLFPDNNAFTPFVTRNLTLDRMLPYGYFYPNASLNNNFRNSNVTQTRAKLPIEIGLAGTSAKSTPTGKPADYYTTLPVEMKDLRLPHASETVPYETNWLSSAILANIENTDVKSAFYNKRYAIADRLLGLENIQSTDSTEAKRIKLKDRDNRISVYDTPIMFIPNDEGSYDITLQKGAKLKGNSEAVLKDANRALHNYSYYTIFDKSDMESIDAEILNKSIDKEYSKELSNKYNTAQEALQAARDHLYETIKAETFNEKTGEVNVDIDKHFKNIDNSEVEAPMILKDGEKRIYKSNIWARSGQSDLELDVALKNAYAGKVYTEQEYMRFLDNVNAEYTKSGMGIDQFNKMTSYTALQKLIALQGYDSQKVISLTQKLGLFNQDKNITKTNIDKAMSELRDLKLKYGKVAMAYDQHVTAILDFADAVKKRTGEPVDCIIALVSPYKITKDKSQNIQTAREIIHNALNIETHDPTSKAALTATAIEKDFFNSSKAIIKELSNMYSASAIKDTLLQKGFVSNEKLMTNTIAILDKVMTESIENAAKGDEKLYIKDDAINRELQNKVFDIIETYTTLPVKRNSTKSLVQNYYDYFKAVNTDLNFMITDFNSKYADTLGDKLTYSDFRDLSVDETKPLEIQNRAKTISNYYFAKIVCGQGMIQSSQDFAKKFTDYISGLAREGKVLTNSYGQIYKRNSIVSPLSGTSLSSLKENMGIAYNSYNEAMWNQFVLEKILSGELYEMDEKFAKHLEENYYTEKYGSQTLDTLKKISKWSAAFQMALPSKMLNRLFSFTGFDYGMGIIYNPKVAKYIGRARREILAAYHSNGTAMSEELKGYFEREGQPVGLTGKDPVTFQESLDPKTGLGESTMKILNKLTDPLEIQNHLGRYAIYLAAKESFDNGDPWYGPVYKDHEAIDKLDNNEDKAMYVMDYMLGSPGGFPQLSRKTAGWMLYTTFPMNFSRTLGAYGLSMGKLFQEGYTSENSKQWMRTMVVPSMGAAAITAFASLLTSFICDLFGVDEDSKKTMIKDLSTIDPVGTIIGGTPAMSSSSANPVQNFKEMFVDPFTKNESLPSKVFGVVNTNVISHLNPAIKLPIELVSGYDFYGATPLNTKYNYNNTENGLRKVLSFFIGSSTANGIVNQYKIDKYSEDSDFFSTLKKGLTNGISASLGNQKSYKKNTTNYYNNIYKVSNYKNNNSVLNYDADLQDLTDGDEMNRLRNYNSKYGSYSYDDYKRISNLMRKMINNKEEPSTVYALIVDEYNKGTSEATLRAVLNNNSIIRKLGQINTSEYLRTLSNDEYQRLVAAIEYEQEMYPMLQYFFPYKEYNNTKVPYYKRYYNSGGGSSYTPRPRTIYPSNSTYYNKYKSYKPSYDWRRKDVKVSPEMGVWNRDYNKVQDLNDFSTSKQRGPVKFPTAPLWYTQNPFYNNLSDYQKRKIGE